MLIEYCDLLILLKLTEDLFLLGRGLNLVRVESQTAFYSQANQFLWLNDPIWFSICFLLRTHLNFAAIISLAIRGANGRIVIVR